MDIPKLLAVFSCLTFSVQALAQSAPTMKMTTDIPPAIVTPAAVDTRLGKLKFEDGIPTEETATLLYDNLDFMRGVEVFMSAMPGASAEALRAGFVSKGADNNTVLIFESLMDSKSLFLTPNTESIYNLMWLDTSDGPLVIETPPNILGIIDDHWFEYVGDLGNAGPDKGKGGKYLLLPPGYNGDIPKGYHVMQSRTYGNLFFWRGFIDAKGSTKTAVNNSKKYAKVYQLSQAKNPPKMKFINVSGKHFNTIHANDFDFYNEVNEIVQNEPSDSYHPEVLGALASIGIEKGKPFAPDARMRKILTEAVAVGNATARAILFRTRMEEAYYYPDSAWFTGFVGGDHQFFSQPGVRNLDARTLFHYYATGITPAMAIQRVGIGSQYAIAATDTNGDILDGSKTYKVHLPPNIPAQNFWSFVAYDNQTRSMLQTDQQFPSIGSQNKSLVVNDDSSVDIWFGPKPVQGHENNWVQTVPGKGWNLVLRLYGPDEAWFDKTWRPGELEPVN
ncbi:DUF1254 domain-containing protein [Gilvimarinus sp. SDUM040013]|uniref:DUF1254 domain-containing protein n=1 Tax=Gilvimarinus gilvus TaxID=3058038 RepID=A0ABU4S1H2_9GAMM|nr:DUF1254 domain-containing protein [Gilvimarinus sp. SDUM040013]MDO3387822.1 DUF1254 domain-containing protein [Gilvimarinus sp. SDUM040013]MDX6851035.1 DUF1254 domain-containing protein [Gilvimarinus sp. SDUM040013]